MYVREWPHQSHMQLYAYQSDSQIRKEFEKVRKERLLFEKKCKQLQKKLKTTQEQAAATKKQYQELYEGITIEIRYTQEYLNSISVYNTLICYMCILLVYVFFILFITLCAYAQQGYAFGRVGLCAYVYVSP